MPTIPENLFSQAASVAHLQVAAAGVSPVNLMRALGLTPHDAGAKPEQQHSPGSTAPFVLLDSAGGSSRLCRFSLLAWDPRLRLTVKDGIARLAAAGGVHEMPAGNPFDLLRWLLEALAPAGSGGGRAGSPGGPLPVTGGAFGMVGYDAGRYIERLPTRAADDLRLPDLDFIFPRKLVCIDHERGQAHLFFEDSTAHELARAAGALRESNVAAAMPCSPDAGRTGYDHSSITKSNMSPEAYRQMVRQAKEYILAGDIFQANLSQRLELDYAGSTLDLYAALRQINPSPFAGLLEMGSYQLVSSSPERLVELSGREAQTRPIAGTRRRGIDFAEDGDLTTELNIDPKERAEHIMLVDLERNDMGRVCDYGSVEVDELMVNEAYSHVIHIVSNVRGRLHRRRGPIDLLRAMFPGGTITGCPKVRCMEIIDELEPVRRGPYTGSFGYIGYDGGMDMNIIIRTLVRVGGRVYAQAGAGIVADSDPEREYQESLRKAEAMVRAVEFAAQAAGSPSCLSS